MPWKLLIVIILLGSVSGAASADDIPKSRSQFAVYMIPRLQLYTSQHLSVAHYPNMPTETEIDVGTLDELIPLDEVYDICAAANFQCEGSLDLFVQNAVELYFNFPDPQPSTMRAGLFLATNRGNDLDDGWAFKGPAVSQNLDGMLMEICFIDPEKHMHELRMRMLSDIKLDRDAAVEICERNLRSALGPLPDIYGQMAPDHIGMVKGSNSESARMILLDQMAKLNAKVGGHLIVAAPTPDILVYSNGDDRDSVAALEARAKQIMLSSEHPLEYDIYEFTGRGWEQLTADEHGKSFLIEHFHSNR